MKLLIDTNILIRAEPTSAADVEVGSQLAVELLRLVAEGGHQALVHPACLEELQGDRDPGRREMRELLAKKYPVLPAAPRVSHDLERTLGRAEPGSHDAVDYLLIAAVLADAVHYVVTDDHRLIRKARRAGAERRLLSPADAVATLRRLLPVVIAPPPAVHRGFAHEIDERDPIFDSFKLDYPGFVEWFRTKCKPGHRLTWTIPDPTEKLAALCITKEEAGGEHGLSGRLLKLSSFKVAGDARGFRFGELLLKAAFEHAFDNSYDFIYLEIFPHHDELIELLATFGFQILPARTKKGELVLAKMLKFSMHEYETLDALDFHVRYGPRHLRVRDAFLVPIQPRFHEMLFPEHAPPTLFAGASPYGNGILKAYLCKSNTRAIASGSALLFYESGGASHVRCVGVVEDSLVSADPEKIAQFVGQRTVYSMAEIRRMCTSPVLALLFRQATGIARHPLSLLSMVRAGAVNGPPQSITRVKGGALPWIRGQLELSP